MGPWAHVRLDAEDQRPIPHALADHLLSVAAGASRNAAHFGERWAYWAGLWHDLGKFRPGFQRYIRLANGAEAHVEGRVADRDKTHSAAGALWADRVLTQRFGARGRGMARVLQYLIAGHHAGLDNWHDGGLAQRLSSPEAEAECNQALAAGAGSPLLEPSDLAALPVPVSNESGAIPGRFALWVRMLFSALVDADFLDTEHFYDRERHHARRGSPTIESLRDALDAELDDIGSAAIPSIVNRARAEVLRQCRDKAVLPPGVFKLTVPTGGGKTLSSLAFALEHAARHGKRRVVYAIPYTSIIEQTADVFRRVFAGLGDGAVIEHHSNAEADPARENHLSRLACENWDAPLVVTTNVQLFESLFARRTSRCRKLHNLVDSVIVLDEAQLLPPGFLQAIVDALQLLVSEYRVTLLLCTATQPVLSQSASSDPTRGLRRGFDPTRVTDIVDDVPALYAALERVHVHLPDDLNTPTPWPELAERVARHEAVLCVVSRRADARELLTLVKQRTGAEGCWHLSALMCAHHRSDVIRAVKAALDARRADLAAGRPARPVRLVSTQLIECGVDIDLPVVYRALAGIDSIAQAAGRCNREGRLDGLGEVHVFVPPTAAPPGLLRQARDTCRSVWSSRPADPLGQPLIDAYFQQLYEDADLDAERICEMLKVQVNKGDQTIAVRFRDASDAFRLIDDDGATVIVRYRRADGGEDVNALIALLEREGPSRWLMRKLQSYGVTLRRRDIDAMVGKRDIVELASCPGLYVQVEGWDGLYDPVFGVNVGGTPVAPAAFVVA